MNTYYPLFLTCWAVHFISLISKNSLWCLVEVFLYFEIRPVCEFHFYHILLNAIGEFISCHLVAISPVRYHPFSFHQLFCQVSRYVSSYFFNLSLWNTIHLSNLHFIGKFVVYLRAIWELSESDNIFKLFSWIQTCHWEENLHKRLFDVRIYPVAY